MAASVARRGGGRRATPAARRARRRRPAPPPGALGPGRLDPDPECPRLAEVGVQSPSGARCPRSSPPASRVRHGRRPPDGRPRAAATSSHGSPTTVTIRSRLPAAGGELGPEAGQGQRGPRLHEHRGRRGVRRPSLGGGGPAPAHRSPAPPTAGRTGRRSILPAEREHGREPGHGTAPRPAVRAAATARSARSWVGASGRPRSWCHPAADELEVRPGQRWVLHLVVAIGGAVVGGAPGNGGCRPW